MNRPGEFVVTFDADPTLSPLEKITKSLDYMNKVDSVSKVLTLVTNFDVFKGLFPNTAAKAHEMELMRNLKCTRADASGNMEFEILLTENLCNQHKTLHGAATTLIFDLCSMCAVVVLAKPGFWALQNKANLNQAYFLGSSRNLNTTFLRPAPLGSIVRVSVQPLHVGTRNALLKCEAYDKASGKLLSHGSHDMVNLAGLGRL